MDSLCNNCKKFFGSQDGLCSKCFKENKMKAASLQTVTEILQASPSFPEETKEVIQVSTDNCAFCNRKLRNINFRCKCNFFFCTQHRLPEEHQCTYDHKAVGIRKLSEENPLVQAQKFNKL